MQTGQLCKMCVGGCKEEGEIALECPICRGAGCSECSDGIFNFGCPRRYCSDITDEINIASLASKGFLPVAGGLLDQTNWFIELWSAIDEEHALIEAERWKSGK